jgi:hypothetical protein
MHILQWQMAGYMGVEGRVNILKELVYTIVIECLGKMARGQMKI